MVSILVFCGHCSHSSSTQIQPNKGKYVFKDNWYHRWSLDRSFEVKIRLEFPQNRQLPPPCWILSRSQYLSRHATRTTRTTSHGEHGITLGTDHYFSGGGGDEKSLSANFFFYLCTSANNFFLTTPSCKQFFFRSFLTTI